MLWKFLLDILFQQGTEHFFGILRFAGELFQNVVRLFLRHAGESDTLIIRSFRKKAQLRSRMTTNHSAHGLNLIVCGLGTHLYKETMLLVS